MTTAFVLTGGGSLGVVQVGMLAALCDRGIEPDLLVGTSVGALNAAYVAGPGLPADRIESLAGLWRSLRRRDVFAAHPRRWLAATVGAAPSVFADTELRAVVEDHLGFGLLEEARVPVHVIATDLVTGQGTALTEGPAVDAVLASAAVPGLLPPVRLRGRTLVDGGVGEVNALAHAEAWGADEIYLLPAGYPCAGRPPSTALGTVLTSLSLLLHRQLIAQVRDHRGPARLHVVPSLCPLSVSPADFTHAPELLRRSRVATDAWLDRGLDVSTGARALDLHEHTAQRSTTRRSA